MKTKTIYVAAPRHERFDTMDPQSVTVLVEQDPRHPENIPYAAPAGHIAIDEGHGVKGDPARANNPLGNPPWQVYPTLSVLRAIGERRLAEVTLTEDTSDLGLDEDDIGSLAALGPRQIEAMRKAGVDTVSTLVERVMAADSAMAWLKGFKGIGDSTAEALRVELVGRGLIDDIDW